MEFTLKKKQPAPSIRVASPWLVILNLLTVTEIIKRSLFIFSASIYDEDQNSRTASANSLYEDQELSAILGESVYSVEVSALGDDDLQVWIHFIGNIQNTVTIYAIVPCYSPMTSRDL